MRDTQSEATQLADVVDVFDAHSEHMPPEIYGDISSELRRLYAMNQELLEALEQMVSVFLDTEGSYGESENDAMDAARAAIAKATGETP